MAFLIGGANSAADTGYNVANSCRWNDDDKPRLYKSNGTPTSRRKFTYSVWLKRASLDAEADLHMMFDIQGNSNRFYVAFFGDKLRVNGTKSGDGTTALDIKTNRIFRDFSAWYHICVAVDTEQGTAADRIKIYVNGTLETSFANASYPDEDEDLAVNESNVEIGNHIDYDNQHYDGYMAEVVFIDGSQEAVTSFGEFNEDSPRIWQPINVSGLTFGTNGFYLDFEDSSNLGNDKNGGTDFTEDDIIAVDQCTDTPTNSFCTLNPLDGGVVNTSLEEGNCKINSTGDSSWGYWASTFHLSTGKWYWEVKMITGSAAWFLGVVESENPNWIHLATSYINDTHGGYGIYKDGRKNEGTTAALATYMAAYSGDDIISFALDLDANRLYVAKNGSWADGSGNNDEASPNAFLDLTSGLIVSNPASWKIVFNMDDNCDCEINFGNPPYANSSDAADADGYGAFEYAPPSGYFALCTKNLAEYG